MNRKSQRQSRRTTYATIIPYKSSGDNNWQEVPTKSWRHLLSTSLLAVNYLLFGATVLSMLESGREDELSSEMSELRLSLVSGAPCVDEVAVDELVAGLLQAGRMGVRLTGNSTGSRWVWGPASSYFFAVSLLTTTGYGNAVPLSRLGKITCLLYLALGIPLVFGFISAVVSRLMERSDRLYLGLHRRFRLPPPLSRLLYVLLVGAVWAASVVLLPAAVIHRLEHRWDFIESVYFCFVSVSTIGLGDFVPAEDVRQKHRSLYKIMAANYLLVGTVFTMFFFAVVKDTPFLKDSKKFGKNMGR